MLPKPVVDYRRFRLRRLRTPEFSHLLLMIFWPVHAILFSMIEKDYFNFGRGYTSIEIWLDDLIPFCEWFLIPYVFWFLFLIIIHVYTLFYDIESYRRLLIFLMVTYLGTLAIYLVWPTQQDLRPTEFARDNVLTRFMASYYAMDTNTNVCPSLHVAGSWAVACGAWKSKHFSTPLWRWIFCLTAALISISTVFVKQHSALDIIVAIPLCAFAWWLAMFITRKPKYVQEASKTA